MMCEKGREIKRRLYGRHLGLTELDATKAMSSIER